jgi:two-component system, OmpR family, sensor histidine kinase QseC
VSIGDLIHRVDSSNVVHKSMLETAARNLVANPVRYSPATAMIEVDVWLNRDTGRFMINMADRGPGLTGAQSSQIGKHFWRGDQGRCNKNGAALGISILRAIVERFGGTLELKTGQSGGLVAEIALPGVCETLDAFNAY